MGGSAAFKIAGIEPSHDPAWHTLGPVVRAEFWRAVVAIGLEEKDRELAEGLDRYGQPLIAISQKTREHRRSAMGPADPNAPPLQPAHSLSRTRSLLDGRAHPTEGYALFFWRKDPVTGQGWGKILRIHAKGSAKLPVRDVIGVSPATVERIRVRAWAWWAARTGSAVVAARPQLAVTAAPAFTFQAVKKYQAKTAAGAVAKSTRRVSQLAVNNDVYTLGATIGMGPGGTGTGTAIQVQRAIANGTFSGFGKVGGGGGPLPPQGPQPIRPTIGPKAHPPHVVPPPSHVKPPPAPKATPKPKQPPPPPKPAPRAVDVELAKPPPLPPFGYRSFSTATEPEGNPRAMNRWGKKAFREWAESLSRAEHRALSEYTSSGYLWMNPIVRTGDYAEAERRYVNRELADRYIASLAEALSRARTTENVIAYRGVKELAQMKVADITQLEPEAIIEDLAFGSTSLKYQKALHFAARGPDGAILEIRVPAGTEAAYVNASADDSNVPAEMELLINRGRMKMRVLEVILARTPLEHNRIIVELVNE